MSAGDLILNIVVGASLGGTFGSTIGAVTTAFQNLAKGDVLGALGDATAALGATMVEAAQKAGDFQQQITMLSTSAGESASNLKTVGNEILKIAEDTGTSTEQLTSAMYYVESAGNHGADGLKVLTTAAQGAKIENADLTTVAKALTTAMTDYHTPVQDANNVMNGLITTVQNGKVSLQDLTSALGQVLPAASSLHVPFSQVAGAMDVMTNAGVNSRMAAMELAHFFLALEAPSNVAQDAMQNVGLSAQQVRDALVSQGLPQALQLIEDHVAKKFPEGSTQATEALKDITGGLMGFKVTASMTGAEMPILEADIKKVSAAYDTAGNSVMGWDQVQQEFNFKISQAQQAFNVMLITLGQQLLPIFSQIVSWVTSVVEKFTDWESQTHFLENVLQGLVTAISTVVGWAKQLYDYLSQSFQAVAPIFDQLSQSAQTWGNNFMVGFLNGMIPIINDIISTVEQVAQEIANYLGFQSPTKKGPGSTLNEWGVGMMSGLAQGIIDSIPLVSDAVEQVATVLQSVSQKNTLSSFTAGSATSAFTGSNSHQMQATVVPEKITQQTTAKMQSTGTSSAETLTKALSTGVKQGVNSVQSAVNSVAATTDTACKAATATSKCVSDNLTKHTANAIKSNTPAVHEAAKKVGEATNPAADAAMKAAEAAHKALTTQLAKKLKSSAPEPRAGAQAIADEIKKPLDQIPPSANKVTTSVSNMGRNASLAAKNMSNSFMGLPAIIERVVSFLQSAGEELSQIWKDVSPGLQSIWRVVQTQLIPALGDFYNTIIKPFVGMVSELAKGFGQWAQEAGKTAQESGALNSAWSLLVDIMKVIVSIAATIIKIMGVEFGKLFQQIATTVTTQLAPAFGDLMTALIPLTPALVFLAKVIGGVVLVALGLLLAGVVAIVKGVAGFATGIVQAFGGAVQIVSGFIQIIVGAITVIEGAIEAMASGKAMNATIMLGLRSMLQGILDMWKGFGNLVVGLIRSIWDAIAGIIYGFAQTVVIYFQNLYDALVGHSIIPDMINAIQGWFQKLVDWIPNLISEFIQHVTDWWNTVETTATTGAKLVFTAVELIFNTAWSTYIQKPLTAFENAFKNWWTQEKAAIQVLAQDLWNAVSDVFSGAWPKLQVDLTKLGQDFTTWWAQQTTQWGQWGTNLVTMFAQGITKAIPTIQNAVSNVANTIKQFLGIQSPAETGPLSTSNTWMANMMNMFSSQIQQGTPKVTASTNAMAASVQQAIDQMSQKVQQSVQDMMTKIQNVGQSLSQMQSQVSAAVSTMKSNVQNAIDDANAAVTSMENTVSNAVTNMNQQINSVSSTLTTMQNNVSNAVAKMNTTINNVNQNLTKMQQNAQASSQQAQSTVSSTDAKINAENNAMLSKAAGALSAFAGTAAAGYARWAAESNSAYLQFSAEENKAIATKQWVAAVVAATQASLQSLISQAQADISSVDSMISSAAATVSSYFAHTEPQQGPLAGDSVWGQHFMQNFITGMQQEIPTLSSVSQEAALKIVENFLPNSKSNRTDITTALKDAAQQLGVTITQLKVKNDDIYATIKNAQYLGGTAGTAGMITTANVLGDIPIQGIGTAGLAGTEVDQYMTIHFDLDGKSLSKTITKYQEGELRVQGVVRGK